MQLVDNKPDIYLLFYILDLRRNFYFNC